MEELARLQAHARGLALVQAVFVRPAGMADGWEHTDLWRSAESIPDVRVITDRDGDEAHRFGAATSGEVRLFDSQGQLLFSGGITGARGHAGDNAGSQAVYAWLRWGSAGRNETFTFGCPLFDNASACTQDGATCKQ